MAAPITKSALDYLEDLDKGVGVAGHMSAKLKDIARANKIPFTGSTRPDEIIEELKYRAGKLSWAEFDAVKHGEWPPQSGAKAPPQSPPSTSPKPKATRKPMSSRAVDDIVFNDVSRTLPDPVPGYNKFYKEHIWTGNEYFPQGEAAAIAKAETMSGKAIRILGDITPAEKAEGLAAIVRESGNIEQGTVVMGHGVGGAGSGADWVLRDSGERVEEAVLKASGGNDAYAIVCDAENKRRFNLAEGAVVKGKQKVPISSEVKAAPNKSTPKPRPQTPPKVTKPAGTPKLPQENAAVRLEKTNQQAAAALGGKVRGGSGMVGRAAKVARGAVKTKQGKAMLGIAALGMLVSLVDGRDETPITYDSDTYNMR